MGEGRGAHHRHHQVQHRDRQRQRHQRAGRPDGGAIALVERAGRPAIHPPQRGHLEILAPEQIAVHPEEQQRREGDDEGIDHQRQKVRDDDHAEEAQGVAEPLEEAQLPHLGQVRIMLLLHQLGHVLEEEAGEGRGDRHHQEHRGQQHQPERRPVGGGAQPGDGADPGQGERVGQHPAHHPKEREIERDEKAEREQHAQAHDLQGAGTEQILPAPQKNGNDHAETQVTAVARSGRGRSGGATVSVPIWT
ncbi:hypothetical protein SDC9_35912 [bioreactor metagenome]|uniref:Uncharacterized protein n=1 Tax=bioreactor metagenome TaxID=1076179 RepID=A0A644VF07_9ZZZZ